jgi:hypothetical protein
LRSNLRPAAKAFSRLISAGAYPLMPVNDTSGYDMMQGTRRIYSGLTWHVVSLPQINEIKTA